VVHVISDVIFPPIANFRSATQNIQTHRDLTEIARLLQTDVSIESYHHGY